MTNPSRHEEQKSKYKILWDYGGYEGMKFHDEDFDSVEEAVKTAISHAYSARWLVVKIIEWKVNEL